MDEEREEGDDKEGTKMERENELVRHCVPAYPG
jgi:hypothetical protein